ncbi:Rv2578c family radical SAM protein [Actinopolyspora xinjiangensis]|uniref:Rv2578c family radical SAM protein n=1 Tax=Actinopolyspora xinjiangensis TaxID=405564 RepID=UPI001B8AB4B2|nr:Rv2578c family radical SAM protein [Actinopolyspora xinjiangensis]
MRWERQRITPPDGRSGTADSDFTGGGTPELDLGISPEPARGGVRGVGAGLRLPESVPIEAGTQDAYAIEVRAKSILNRVPGDSHVPFQWTLNPYRGCGHACRYCFARNTHTYLDLDAGHDFDSKIVVKVNAGRLLRGELASPKWRGDPVAMGTNTDPYQRAEGRYGLMREIITALTERANPFSILTKGTLILRDLDLIESAAEVTDVSIAVSIGSLDERLWRKVEPGTPAPARRLEVVRRFAEAGVGCSVLMAPILPGLSDSAEHIEHTVAALAEAGARSITPLPLHLRPGAREWYRAWLQREYPSLVPLYARLYREGSYVPESYQREVIDLVERAKRAHGVHRPSFGAERGRARGEGAGGTEAEPQQLSLL